MTMENEKEQEELEVEIEENKAEEPEVVEESTQPTKQEVTPTEGG